VKLLEFLRGDVILVHQEGRTPSIVRLTKIHLNEPIWPIYVELEINS